MTLIPEYLTDEATARKAAGHDVVVLRGNCFATKERLDIYKELGVKYVLTRTVGVNHIDIPYAKELGFKRILGVGFEHDQTYKDVINEIKNYAYDGECLYEEDEFTDVPMRFIAKEIIRENALQYLYDELPHSIAVEITEFVENEKEQILSPYRSFCVNFARHPHPSAWGTPIYI